MEDEAETGKKVRRVSTEVPDLWLGELQRSQEILKNVLNALPPESRKELVELLRIIAEGNGSRETRFFPTKRALQIPNTARQDEQALSKPAQHAPEQSVSLIAPAST